MRKIGCDEYIPMSEADAVAGAHKVKKGVERGGKGLGGCRGGREGGERGREGWEELKDGNGKEEGSSKTATGRKERMTGSQK